MLDVEKSHSDVEVGNDDELVRSQLSESQSVDEVKQAKEQAAINAEVEQQVMHHTDQTIMYIKSMWWGLQAKLLEKLGRNDENIAWITETCAQVQQMHLDTVHHAQNFVELFNWHVNGTGGDLDLGALFAMNEDIRGFHNVVRGQPLSTINLVDKSIPGYDDPRFRPANELPLKQLVESGGDMSIPVKAELFDAIVYGYLCCFKFDKVVNGKPITMVTTQPALLTKAGYVTINSIYRWTEVSKEAVKDAWTKGKSHVYKKTDSIATDTIKGEEDEPQTEQATATSAGGSE